MEESKKISADEARNIAALGGRLLNRLYKLVREAAAESETEVNYQMNDPAEAALQAVEKDFKEHGFVVEISPPVEEGEQYNIHIAW